MKKRWVFLAELIVLSLVCTWVALALLDFWTPRPPGSISIGVKLPDAHDRAYLYQQDGQYWYLVTHNNRRQEALDPVEFTRRVYNDQTARSWPEVLLNISSPWGLAWVTVGLLGQVLFTGRMMVQWLASEKKQESVVPPVFWWMSLFGSTMLLIYFLWRVDAIGILGQAFGWFVYGHNLWLIYRPHQGGRADSPPRVTEDPAPEPEWSEK